VDSLLALSGLY